MRLAHNVSPVREIDPPPAPTPNKIKDHAMFDNLRRRLSAVALLAHLPAPIPVGTVTGRIVSDEPNLEEFTDQLNSKIADGLGLTPEQLRQPMRDQQLLVGKGFGYDPDKTHYIALEQDYSQVEARINAALARDHEAIGDVRVRLAHDHTDDSLKLMQLPRDPGLSATRRLSVSSKMARAWDKIKPTSLSAEDVARLDAAQQKRDRKAAKRANDRVYFIHGLDSSLSPWTQFHALRGDRNAYAVH